MLLHAMHYTNIVIWEALILSLKHPPLPPPYTINQQRWAILFQHTFSWSQSSKMVSRIIKKYFSAHIILSRHNGLIAVQISWLFQAGFSNWILLMSRDFTMVTWWTVRKAMTKWDVQLRFGDINIACPFLDCFSFIRVVILNIWLPLFYSPRFYMLLCVFQVNIICGSCLNGQQCKGLLTCEFFSPHYLLNITESM